LRGEKAVSRDQDPCGELIRASVAKVCDTYVVTYPQRPCGDLTTRDSITFSLKDWNEDDLPEHGQIVYLRGTSLWHSGWRAREAFPVRLN
jgi:hypothetical protein